ncbi:MAG: glycosyltransferase family 2 protein [Candidatus Diapherotrites archaeon]|uniref:Glycosyltransferase family 2 protein n=1 Tax=Candidatus Iainarchaeum sp. TaxID=3101447 RepID=A0A8T4LLF4_9ARCH|nr:glycosyltransferase family 2 protein [Candidatus Diapherotrites archaeon]
MKLVAVIPAHNEAQTIAGVVKAAQKFVDLVLVVDDGSTDATKAEAERAGARVYRSLVNMGKGFALRLGVEQAVQAGAEIVACLDADGQHNPVDIPGMVKMLENEKLDLVVGSRPLDEAMPPIMRLGNLGIYWLTLALYGIRVRDTQSGFRVFKASRFPSLKWEANGYEVESEMLCRMARNGLKCKEYPIKTLYRDKYKGTNVADGLRIGLNLVWWKLFG